MYILVVASTATLKLLGQSCRKLHSSMRDFVSFKIFHVKPADVCMA